MTDQTPDTLRALDDQPPRHIVDLAVDVSGWSPCRSKHGVVIFNDQSVIAHGYNYKPRGFDCDGTEACKATCRVEAVHAEQHALLAAGRLRTHGAEMLHVKTVEGRLVAYGGPSCVQCSKLTLVAGISAVWLYHEDGWRRYGTVEFHELSLRALADQSQRVQEGCVVLSEADVMDQLSAQAWCQGVRPAIEAKSADEFVAKMINALRSEAAPAPAGAPHACDEGWICEAHPGQPWPHDACLGPGMPCPCGRAFRTSEAQARAERRPATPAPTGAEVGCILNCDSPSYPPEQVEYEQCAARGCRSCIAELKRRSTPGGPDHAR